MSIQEIINDKLTQSLQLAYAVRQGTMTADQAVAACKLIEQTYEKRMGRYRPSPWPGFDKL